jgi:nitrite reductase/ring-hydroxylating ferredoxin subunit/putative sterol carrier protein
MTKRRYPMTPFPDGWFRVAYSDELKAGEVKPLKVLGKDLVLFRTESGAAAVLDAFCPHLGAHLGYGGTVLGETLRCPFHHFRFDAKGQCVDVAGCDRVPPSAKASPWHVVEHNGTILAWFHPEGAPPSYQVRVLEDEGWTENLCVRWTLRSHPQEIGENTVDTAHMMPVHETGFSRVRHGPHLEGPVMRIGLYFLAPGSIIGMDGDNDVELEVAMYGVGLIQVEANVTNAGVQARYRISSTPIDRERIHIFGVANMKQTGDPEFTKEVAGLFFEALTRDFVKDFDIWENKVYRPRPALSAADGPIGAYRRWSRQFYPAQEQQRAEPRGRAEGGAIAAAEPEGLLGAVRGRATEALVGVRSLLSRVRGVVQGVRGSAYEGGRPGDDHHGDVHHARDARDVHDAYAGRSGAHAPRDAAADARDAYAGRSGAHAPHDAAAAAREAQAGRATPGAHAGTSGSAGRSSLPKVTSVAEYFATLEQRFVPAATRGLDAVFQWEIAGDEGGTYHAIVKDGTMQLTEGRHPQPTVTIAMPAADYVKVVNGELDGARAFTTGRGKVSGKIRMAMKMRSIFPQTS